MALTLTEGELYTTTHMYRTLIDRLVKESKILEKLPFVSILGNSLTYDTVTTRSDAAFYAVSDTWVESTPSLTQATVALKKLGGDAQVDNFILDTRADQIDIKGAVLDDKVKAVQEAFLDQFYYGTDIDAKGFAGLQSLISSTTYNTVHAGATTGTALSIDKLRTAIDLITGFKAQAIVMGKEIRRKLSVYLDSVGDKFPMLSDHIFGGFLPAFDGIPIIVDDHILNTEVAASGAYSAPTGGGNTTIFVLTFGEQGACGVQGKNGIQMEPLGNMETKDAQAWRIKWYCGLMFKNLRSCAKVDGIVSAGTVTA